MKGLVIGLGPSLKEKDALRAISSSNFQGCLLISDRALKDCLAAGVTPDRFPNYYVFTIEDMNAVSNYIIPGKYAPKIKVIHSARTKPHVLIEIKKRHYQTILFDWDYLTVTPNVGLMAFCYGWKELGLTDLCLIGLDTGMREINCRVFHDDHPGFNLFYEKINGYYLELATHSIWRETFIDFLQLMPKGILVLNCSDGTLPISLIKRGELKEWLVQKA